MFMFPWDEDPNDPRSPKEQAMNTALNLDANNVPVGPGTPMAPRTPYEMPALRRGEDGSVAAWAPGIDPWGQTPPTLNGLIGEINRYQNRDPVNIARSMAAAPAAPPPVMTPNMASGALAGILSGSQQNGPAYINGGTAPTYSGGPGAGWGRNSHPSDYEYTARAGIPLAPHVWTEADLDPTHTLGYTGSLRKAFSGGDTYGYTAPSPNLPLFRADMASRAQGLNFAAEMANSLGRQAFQASENEKDRQLKRDLEEANNQAKKNQSLALLASPNTPSDIKNIEMASAKSKGTLNAQEIASLKLSDLLGRANALGFKPDSLDYWKYLSANFDPAAMDKSALISKLQEAGVKAPDVATLADPGFRTGSITSGLGYWLSQLFGGDKPEDVRARNFARSLLSK